MGVRIGAKFKVRLNISLTDTQEPLVRPATPTITIGKNPRHSSATGQSTYDILPCPIFLTALSILWSQGGYTMDKGRSFPEWVASELKCPIWAFVGSMPCSRVTRQVFWHLPYFACTGAYTENPLLFSPVPNRSTNAPAAQSVGVFCQSDVS